MTTEMTVWILGIGMALCLLCLFLVTGYFLREWKKLDVILESFRNENFDRIWNRELRETRESRITSQLFLILNSVKLKEQKTVEEKDQIMELISDLSHQLKTPLTKF